VTGASAGVGRATARAFAREGFDVALLARGRAGLEAAAKEVEQAGGRALAVPTDVAEWEEVDSAASRVEAELGPVAVWVNNAMTTAFAWFEDIEPHEFRRATEVTYLGQVHGTMAALNRMRPRDQGRIVNVGSALSFVGIPLQAAYCGAKFACRGFFESVRAELLAQGSRVTISMVHLPAVNTPQFEWCLSRLPHHPQPVPPIYQPEVCARFVVAAAGDGRRAKLLGAWTKLIVAGTKLAPGVLSQYAARTGVSSQQTSRPTGSDRPANLFSPVDDDHDQGAHGIFGHRAGGALDPQFRRSLPHTLQQLATAVAATAREKLPWPDGDHRLPPPCAPTP
jgi:NAD(P)-dependent dehydrogenase (short-subunit alcohol dehydrogenase family)